MQNANRIGLEFKYCFLNIFRIYNALQCYCEMSNIAFPVPITCKWYFRASFKWDWKELSTNGSK